MYKSRVLVFCVIALSVFPSSAHSGEWMDLCRKALGFKLSLEEKNPAAIVMDNKSFVEAAAKQLSFYFNPTGTRRESNLIKVKIKHPESIKIFKVEAILKNNFGLSENDISLLQRNRDIDLPNLGDPILIFRMGSSQPVGFIKWVSGYFDETHLAKVHYKVFYKNEDGDFIQEVENTGYVAITPGLW